MILIIILTRYSPLTIMNVSLFIDSREVGKLDKVNIDDIPFTFVRHLDIGDYILSFDSEDNFSPSSVLYVVERKTVTDLASSVIDGRYKNQKSRMHNLINNDSKRIIYIIEGFSFDLEDDCNIGSLCAKTIKTIVYNLQVVEGCSVFISNGPNETFEIINGLRKRLTDNPKKYSIDPQYDNNKNSNNVSNYSVADLKIKKSDALSTTNDFAVAALATIPRVSQRMAIILLSEMNCNSLTDFVNLCSEKPDITDIISKIKIGNKAIGKTTSERILSMIGYINS